MEPTLDQIPGEEHGSARSSQYTNLISLGTPHQRHWITQQNKSGRVVRQVVADLVEALVYRLLFILLDFLGRLIDHV